MKHIATNGVLSTLDSKNPRLFNGGITNYISIIYYHYLEGIHIIDKPWFTTVGSALLSIMSSQVCIFLHWLDVTWCYSWVLRWFALTDWLPLLKSGHIIHRIKYIVNINSSWAYLNIYIYISIQQKSLFLLKRIKSVKEFLRRTWNLSAAVPWSSDPRNSYTRLGRLGGIEGYLGYFPGNWPWDLLI